MLVLWKLKTRKHPPKHITTSVLAEALHCPISTISTILRRIDERRTAYFEITQVPNSIGHPGRPRMSYSLNSLVVVTFPETALMLLELRRYHARFFRIKRKEFLKSVASKFHLDLKFLHERLEEAVRAEYVRVPGRGCILPSARIESEELYLEL